MKYENEIRKIINKIIDVTESIDEVQIDRDLREIGLTSLTFVNLIIELEDFFDISFPNEKFTMTESGTIKALCETVALLEE